MSKVRTFPGLYRGVVEDTADPDQRLRTRVRVHETHPDSIPIGHLPWAEFNGFVGKDFGDVPHFEPGDVVWVMFERGDRQHPVVMGAYCRAPDDIPDFPRVADKGSPTDVYEKHRKRWIRVDRAGNRIIMSENDDETRIEIHAVAKEKTSLSFRVYGDGRMEIEAKGVLQVVCEDLIVDVSNDATVGVGNDANVTVTNDANVTVDGKLAATVKGDVAVTSTTGEVTVESSAQKVVVKALVKVEIDAPFVDIGGTPVDFPVLAMKLQGLFQTALLAHVHEGGTLPSGTTGKVDTVTGGVITASLLPPASASISVKMNV